MKIQCRYCISYARDEKARCHYCHGSGLLAADYATDDEEEEEDEDEDEEEED